MYEIMAFYRKSDAFFAPGGDLPLRAGVDLVEETHPILCRTRLTLARYLITSCLN